MGRTPSLLDLPNKWHISRLELHQGQPQELQQQDLVVYLLSDLPPIFDSINRSCYSRHHRKAPWYSLPRHHYFDSYSKSQVVWLVPSAVISQFFPHQTFASDLAHHQVWGTGHMSSTPSWRFQDAGGSSRFVPRGGTFIRHLNQQLQSLLNRLLSSQL